MNLIGVSRVQNPQRMDFDFHSCKNAVKFTDQGSVKCTVSVDPNRPTPDPEMVSIKFVVECVVIHIAIAGD